jgi:IS30 family transposase
MKRYRQLTSEERYALSTLRKQGYSVRGIAHALDRAPSTISREVRRNSRKDGGYRPGQRIPMTSLSMKSTKEESNTAAMFSSRQ